MPPDYSLDQLEAFAKSRPTPPPGPQTSTVPQVPVKQALTKLDPADETAFQSFYAKQSARWHIDPNPDDPRHFYDYRAAWKAGKGPDNTGHWPSDFKFEGNPRLILNGVNTKTGKRVPLPAGYRDTPNGRIKLESGSPSPSVTITPAGPHLSDPQVSGDFDAFKEAAKQRGYDVQLVSGDRTAEQQARLYANRASNPLPVAPPGRSQHNAGRAVDVHVLQNGKRVNPAVVADLAKEYGWSHLGALDPPHFNYVGRQSPAEPSLADVEEMATRRPAAPPQQLRPVAPGTTTVPPVVPPKPITPPTKGAAPGELYPLTRAQVAAKTPQSAATLAELRHNEELAQLAQGNRKGDRFNPFTGEPHQRRSLPVIAGETAENLLFAGAGEEKARANYYSRAAQSPKEAPPQYRLVNGKPDPNEVAQGKSVFQAGQRAYDAAASRYQSRFNKLTQGLGRKAEAALQMLQLNPNQENQRKLQDLLGQYQKARDFYRQQFKDEVSAPELGRAMAKAGPLAPFQQKALGAVGAALQEKADLFEQRQAAALTGALSLGVLPEVETLGAPLQQALSRTAGVAGKKLAGTALGKTAAEGARLAAESPLAQKAVPAAAKALRTAVNLPGVNPVARVAAGTAKAVGRALAPDEHAVGTAIAGALQQGATYVASEKPEDIRADRLLSEALGGAAGGYLLHGGFKLTSEGLGFVRNAIKNGLEAKDALRQAFTNSSYAAKENPAIRPAGARAAKLEAQTKVGVRQSEQALAKGKFIEGGGEPTSVPSRAVLPKPEPVAVPAPKRLPGSSAPSNSRPGLPKVEPAPKAVEAPTPTPAPSPVDTELEQSHAALAAMRKARESAPPVAEMPPVVREATPAPKGEAIPPKVEPPARAPRQPAVAKIKIGDEVVTLSPDQLKRWHAAQKKAETLLGEVDPAAKDAAQRRAYVQQQLKDAQKGIVSEARRTPEAAKVPVPKGAATSGEEQWKPVRGPVTAPETSGLFEEITKPEATAAPVTRTEAPVATSERTPLEDVDAADEARAKEAAIKAEEMVREFERNATHPKRTAAAHAAVDAELAKTTEALKSAPKTLPGKGNGGRSGATLSPDEWALYAKHAALTLAKHGLNAADFAEAMVRDIGEHIRPHLDELRTRADEWWKENRDRLGRPGHELPQEKTNAVQEKKAAAGVLRDQGIQRESGLQGVGGQDQPEGAPRRGPEAQAKPTQEVAPKSQVSPAAAAVNAEVAAKPHGPLQTEKRPLANDVSQSTGISNRFERKEADAGFIPRVGEKDPVVSREDLNAKAQAEAEKVGIKHIENVIAKEIGAGERTPNARDIGLLKQGKKIILKDVRSARQELDHALNNGYDEASVARFRANYLEEQRRIQTYVDNVQKGKTGWAQVGHALRDGVDIDTGNFDEVKAEARRLAGRDLTKKESDHLQALAGKIDEVTKAMAALQTKYDALAEQSLKQAGEKAARQRPNSTGTRTITEIRASKAANIEKFKKLYAENAPHLEVRMGSGLGVAEVVPNPKAAPLREVAPELAKTLGAIAKDVWDEGVKDLEDLVGKVREALGHPSGVADSDIVHAYLEARDLKQKTPDEAKAGKTLATKQAQEFVEREERLENGETPTAAQEKAHKEVLASLQGMRDTEALNKHEQALLDRIEKVKKGPMVGPPEPPNEVPPKIKALQEELADLNKQQRKLREDAERDRTRPDQEATALAKRAQGIRDKIAAAEAEDVAARAQRLAQAKAEREVALAARPEEIAQLTQELEAVREEKRLADAHAKADADLKAAEAHLKQRTLALDPITRKKAIDAGLKETRAALRRINAKRYLQRQIAELDQQIEQGFGPMQGPPKEAAALDEELLNLKAKKAVLDQHIKQQLEAIRPKTLGERVGAVLKAPTALVASIDLSAPGRQGWLLGLSHPVIAGRAFGEQLRALSSPEAAAKAHLQLLRRENVALYKRAGLHLSEGTGLGPGEEAFGTHLFPGWKKYNPFHGSERAYSAYLNRLRADSFDAMLKFASKNGKEPLDQEGLRAIAHYVNAATGRGASQKPQFGATADFLSNFLFAPRFVYSRFEYASGSPFHSTSSLAAKKAIGGEYARTYAALLGSIAAVGMLAKGQGFEVNLDDPSSTDWLKLKKGNVRIDLLAGLQQASVFAYRAAAQKTTSAGGKETDLTQGKYGQTTNEELLGRFVRSKLNPLVGTAWSLRTGKNYVGEKYGPREAVRDLITPLSARDIVGGLLQDGWNEEDAWNLLNLLGISVQIYDDTKRK